VAAQASSKADCLAMVLVMAESTAVLMEPVGPVRATAWSKVISLRPSARVVASWMAERTAAVAESTDSMSPLKPWMAVSRSVVAPAMAVKAALRSSCLRETAARVPTAKVRIPAVFILIDGLIENDCVERVWILEMCRYDVDDICLTWGAQQLYILSHVAQYDSSPTGSASP
jgi:hypothetical protein